MSKSSHVHTIRLPLRKICSALPAVALIGGGILLPASAAPTAASRIGLASEGSPAVVVPDTELTLPSSSQNLDDPLSGPVSRAPVSRPPAPLLQAGVLPGSSSPVTLDSTGIPVRALEAYRRAAALTGSADPGCHLDWALVAAIGRVESDHGRYGGNQLDSTGTAQPGIIGIPLDGSNATARITDTDHGLFDRDTVFDRAVGPMQFIPGTWAVAGVDANGDGVKNPQNMSDAATATTVYLCSGSGDLRNPADLRSAILRYNPSDSYVSMVTAIADAYRHGVKALPASEVAPVKPSTAKSRTSAARVKLAAGKPGAHRPGSAPAGTKGKKPPAKPQSSTAPTPALTQVPAPRPTTPSPTSTTSTSTTPTSTSTTSTPPTSTSPQPTPTTTCVPIPSTTSTTATGTPSGPSPTPTQTCLPPCLASASPTSTASPTPTGTLTCLPPCVSATAPASPTSTALSQLCLAPTATKP